MIDKNTLQANNIPQHIAVIMDGNGRWAKQQGHERTFGHQNAITAVREIVEASAEIGVKFLTLYAFSTENWKRPEWEVTALMELLVSSINAEVGELMKNDIRLTTIGDTKSLPEHCQQELAEAMNKTKDNKRLTLILALSYSSRWELTEAVKEITRKCLAQKLDPASINENTISEHLSTSKIPEPELMIRTSGELRISNFLLWQLAYAELYFTDKLWPDFRKADLFEAIHQYQLRERRFGMTSEQITK